MRKFLSSLAAVAALFSASPAQADWLQIATSSNGSKWFMDPERIKIVGTKTQAWARIDSSRDNSVRWREAKQLLSFDCAAETYKTIAYITYDSYGKIISSNSVPDYGTGYAPVVPESMAESVLKLACLKQ